MRNTIFISYSHRDKKWLDRFENALKIGVLRDAYNTWSDRQLPVGKKWNEEIEAKISAAKIALLLVTPEFLQSEYISRTELKTILDLHSRHGLELFWVPIKYVTETNLQMAGLKQIQAPWSDQRPLDELSPTNCKRAIDEICDKLITRLGTAGSTSTQTIQDLQNDLAAELGAKYVLGDQIAFGEFSVVYKASSQRGKEVAIKIVLPSMRRKWIASDFIARANYIQDIDPPFLRIIDTISRDRVDGVIMEYVEFPTLKSVIQKSGPLQPAEVADVLSQVAQAAEKFHEKTVEPQNLLLVGPLHPSHIYRNPRDNTIKISPVHISHATLASAQARPMPMLTENELTSLAPERYEGERTQLATDQYYIALLGLELLTGAPPVSVHCYADLDKKKAFFDAPMTGWDEHRKKSPALFFVLRRMLERRPENRWEKMADAREALTQVAKGSVPDQVRDKASKVYFDVLQSGDFYYDFYSEFFRICPKAREIFEKSFETKKTNLQQQRDKLHRAVGALLNFRPKDDPNPLSEYAESHQTLRLLPEHFDAFREAFLTELARQSKVDDYHVDAWRAVLDAGIAYMTKWPGRRNGESPSPKSPATRADDIRPIATQVYATRGGKDG
jgi:serine/threonine protein kinase